MTTTLGDAVAQCEELLDTLKNGALDAMQADFDVLANSLTQAIKQANGAIPSAVAAETYKMVFVDPTRGDDVTGDGTSGKPLKTISRAITMHGKGVCLEIRLTAGAVYNETVNISNGNRRWVILTCHEGVATVNVASQGTWIAAGSLFLATYKVDLHVTAGSCLGGFRNNTGCINFEQSLMLIGGTYTIDGELMAGGGHLNLYMSGTLTSTNPATIMPLLGRNYQTVRFSKGNIITHWPAGKTWRDFLQIGGSTYNNIITNTDIDA